MPVMPGLQSLERPIERQHLFRSEFNGVVAVGQSGDRPVPAPLRRHPAPRVVDEDLPHGSGGDRQEVGAVHRVHPAAARQLDVGLVDEGRGVEGVVGSLASQLPAGHGAQLVVDDRQQPVQRVSLAAANRLEKPRHVARGNGVAAGCRVAWGRGVVGAHGEPGSCMSSLLG